MLRYEEPLRRRARQLRRIVRATAQPEVLRRGVVVPAFWWDGHPNFGDDMTPWLLPRYGVVPVYREPRAARLAGVGSVLEFLQSEFSGSIWGSGLMTDVEHPLPAARVLAVRGPLTHERIGATGRVPFGDPGILIGRHVPRSAVRVDIAVVPHGHHRNHAGLAQLMRAGGGRARVINVHQGAEAAAREISAGRAVLTTSLHGLITADAYGIPAVWTMLDPPLGGGDFKFRDYEAALTPGRTRFMPFGEIKNLEGVAAAAWAADADAVSRMSDGLERALGRLRGELPDLSRFPAGLFRAFSGRGR